MFRARSAMTRRETISACTYAEVIYEIITPVLERFANPLPVTIHKMQGYPSIIAQQVRRTVNIPPDTPISNLINSIEKCGVLFLALPLALEKIDAFSMWAGTDVKRPIIALSASKPGDRLRWNTAHELGHLVMHGGLPQLRIQEHREADQFAAELLMPEASMHQELTSPVTLSSVAPLKRKWGVAIQSLVRRAFDLNIITQRNKDMLFAQIGAKGWRTREPENLDVPVEKPRALRKMAEIAYGKPINYVRLASDAHITVEMARQIVDGYGEAPTPTARGLSEKVIQFR